MITYESETQNIVIKSIRNRYEKQGIKCSEIYMERPFGGTKELPTFYVSYYSTAQKKPITTFYSIDKEGYNMYIDRTKV